MIATLMFRYGHSHVHGRAACALKGQNKSTQQLADRLRLRVGRLSAEVKARYRKLTCHTKQAWRSGVYARLWH